MITAIYTHNKIQSGKPNPLMPYVITMLIAYAVGCITVKIFSATDFISAIYTIILSLSDSYGYIGCFFALFLPKLVLFLVIAFSAYFCFGKISTFIIAVSVPLFYGQLSGFLYSEYSFRGVIIFASSFLIFGVLICVFGVHRLNDAAKISTQLYRVAFLKETNSAEYNNKEFFIKTLITLLLVLIISLLQGLIFKIVIYFI